MFVLQRAFTIDYKKWSQHSAGMFSDWNYCNLDLLLSYINENHPTCSALIGDFNAKSSKWCNSDKSDRVGIELDSITTSAGYSQLINEPTHFVNKTSSCIDLIFSSDLNITRNCGIEKTIHENVIMILYTELWISMCPFLLLIIEKSGITNMQILRIFKKLFQCLIGTKHLRIKIQTKWLGY